MVQRRDGAVLGVLEGVDGTLTKQARGPTQDRTLGDWEGGNPDLHAHRDRTTPLPSLPPSGPSLMEGSGRKYFLQEVWEGERSEVERQLGPHPEQAVAEGWEEAQISKALESPSWLTGPRGRLAGPSWQSCFWKLGRPHALSRTFTSR